MRLIHLSLASCLVVSGCGAEAGMLARRAHVSADAERAAANGYADVTSRRLLSVHYQDAASTAAAISPDGRHLLVGDSAPWFNARRLRLLEVATGKVRPVPGAVNAALGLGAIFSRDGKGVAYIQGAWPQAELRVVDLAGGTNRVLWSHEATTETALLDWSPDGGHLLVRPQQQDGTRQLVLVATRDGALRPLRSFAWEAPGAARFSPDGRFIAYDRRQDQDGDHRDIFIIAVDGSRDVRVTEDGGSKLLLGWSQSGDGLLYATRHSDGSSRIWRLPVANGRRSGSPELVRADVWGFSSVRGGLTGDVLYHRTGGRLNGQLFEAQVDLEHAVATSAPQPISGSRDAWGPAAWSPDGSRVAYRVDGAGAVVVRSAATGEVLEFQPSLQTIHLVQWAPGGGALMLAGYQRGQSGLFRYDLSTGALDRISAPYAGDGPALDAAATTLYEARSDGTGVVARDLATGAERVLLEGIRVAYGSISTSPDGNRIAYIRGEMRDGTLMGTVEVVPVTGGEPVVLFADAQRSTPDRLHRYSSVAWSPDGRHVLFSTHAPEVAQRSDRPLEFGRQSIMVVPAAGGTARILLAMDDMPLRLRSISVHPHGGRILFSGGGDPDTRLEIWAMENISPAGGTARRRP